MATSPIAASGSNSLQTINLESFMKIVLAQLTYQDPMKPVDSAQFITQLAQITSLEQTRQLTDRMDSLVAAQGSSQLIGLLGRKVEIGGDFGAQVGVVTDVTFDTNGQRFTMRTDTGEVLANLGADRIVRVTQP